MAYIIPARFYHPLKLEDLEAHGWKYSPLAKTYFLEGSLTDEEQSGVWIRQFGKNWIITDCNFSELRVLHNGELCLIDLIRLTHLLWSTI